MESFASIFARAENPMATAMVLMLSWIAACDGAVSDEELEELRSIAASGKGTEDLSAVIEIARSGSVADLQLACEVLREVELKHRRLMLQMAVGMALEDGYLTATEGHIVRFLADVLSQTPSDLDALFREMTGQPFPPAADPSSVEWWDARERSSRGPQSSNARDNGPRSAAPHRRESTLDMRRLRDLAALGLDEDADTEGVREAYRRMAKVHHPDRFAALGPEAVKAAELSFRRIQEAYERLAQ
jgi:DnaJ-domain-containing protein 1